MFSRRTNPTDPISRNYFVPRLAGIFLLALAWLTCVSMSAATTRPAANASVWKMWQIAPAGKQQAMSYVLQTGGGKLIVVDGGWEDDAPTLAAFIKARGGIVTAWFITHPHQDHVGALTSILTSASPPAITTIYASLPTEDFVRKFEPTHLIDLLKFNAALAAAKKTVHDIAPGENLTIDGLRVEIIGGRNPEIHRDAINNSSMVFRVTGQKSILFLGDLGPEGGKKILAGEYKNLVHADFVQMAHHGQGGVDEAFYTAVAPSVCLWPTPRWLWENDAGAGPNTGPFTTLITRAWMTKLGVKKNIVSMNGTARIDD